MKFKTVLSRVLIVIVIAGVALAIWRYSTRPKFSSVSQELEYNVSDAVKSNKQIHNCTLYVTKGDGSFTWSGAAGIASQTSQAPMTKDTPIYIASITKIYTATAIMKLYEEGKLSLDDPMAKYLSEDLIHGIDVYQGHDYSDEITIAQLLAQTSGLADYYTDQPAGGQDLFHVFMANPDRTWTTEELIARARDELQPHFAPNMNNAYYADTNYALLGKIIESVTGKPLQDVYKEFFFQPLGLTHTWLVGLSEPQIAPSAAPADVFANDANITKIRSNGAYWADGGIVSTAQEAVMFLKALNEGRIIRKETLDLMHHWHPIENVGPFQYGYGTMKFEVPSFINWAVKVPPVWGDTGSVGSFLYYSSGQDLYMAGTIDQTEDRVTPVMLMIKVMQAIH